MNATAYYQHIGGEVEVLSISTSIGSRPINERFLKNLEYNGHTVSVYAARAVHYNTSHTKDITEELRDKIISIVKEKMKATMVRKG